MMVREKKAVFTLADLTKIRFECCNCGVETVVRLDRGRPMHSACPSCGWEWAKPPLDNSGYDAYFGLVLYLQRALQRQDQESVKISFEVDDD